MKFKQKRIYLSLKKDVEKELLEWLKKLRLYPLINLEQLKKAVYQCKKDQEFRVFEPFIKKAQKINPHLKKEDIEAFLFFLHNQFWNISSIGFLGGKSPFQLIEEKIIKNPKKNIFHHPIFYNVILPFKITLEKVFDSIEDKNKKNGLINSLPLIFKRYWYSPMKEGEGDSSPFLVFLRITDFYAPNTDFYPFPSYENSELIFNGIAVEETNWDLFPIISDLKEKKKNYFYRFEDYVFIAEKLKKMNFSIDFDFFSYFVDFLLLFWKRLDPIIKNLPDKDWLTIWRSYLNKAAENVVDTEGIIYPIILLLKKEGIKVNFILEWLSQWPNLVNNKNLSEEEKAQDFFFFKLITDFDRFFITPLTLFLPVFNLIYAEKFNLEEEIELFLNFSSEVVFYKPPTKLTFNEFGRWLFKKHYS